jgi:uncharacterized repeat protein (TIGR01451 family)
MPSIPATGSYAALGIHADSGTLYTLDRNSGILYYYSLTGTTWNNIDIHATAALPNGVPIIIGVDAVSNINKMTITGNTLYLADSASKYLYSLSVNATTGVPSGSSITKTAGIIFTGTTSPGNPSVNASNIPYDWLSSSYIDYANNVGTFWVIGGGDITNDEYGNTYNVTYDNHYQTTYNSTTKKYTSTLLNSSPTGQTNQYAYFYKLNSAKTEWQYLGKAAKKTGSDQYAGVAFYADQLYLKGTAGQLFQVPLTGTNGNYSGWNTPLIQMGTTAGIGTSDMASCGTPALTVSKTYKIFLTDAVTPSPQQDRVGKGQYVKYTIVVQNVGDAWARGTSFSDVLPPGMTYLPNSATMSQYNTATSTIETVNLNAATYPFTLDYVATSPGSNSGEIRLPLNSNTDTVTFTYIAKVDGTAPTIKNRATTKYTIPVASAAPNCTIGLNCGESPLQTLYPSIFGTVWNDTNGSAAGTFSNIFTTGEAGTNTGTTNALYALLLDSSNKVLLSQPVGSNGKYSFEALDTNQSNLKIQLSTTTYIAGATPTTASIPPGWKATSPKITPALNLVTTDILNEDFGISLPAGIILIKRITAINGQTTNPNDSKDLSIVVDSTTTTTTNDDPARKWPAGYLKGEVNGGKIKPGDTIEYTIYYLNDGSADAKTLRICDPIRGGQTYVPNSMKLIPGGASTAMPLTDNVDTVDRANRYLTVAAAPTDCNASGSTVVGTDRGGVTIQVIGSGATGTNPQPDLVAIPGATTAGNPVTSYGSFKFTTIVNP